MQKVALSEVKDDLSKYLRIAEKEEVVITRRFWERTTDANEAFLHNFDDVHYNPIKHDLLLYYGFSC